MNINHFDFWLLRLSKTAQVSEIKHANWEQGYWVQAQLHYNKYDYRKEKKIIFIISWLLYVDSTHTECQKILK